MDVAVRRPRLLAPRCHSLTRPRERGARTGTPARGPERERRPPMGERQQPPNGSGQIRRERGRILRGRARSQPRRPAANAVKQVKIWGSGKEAREEESVGVRPPALRRVAQPRVGTRRCRLPASRGAGACSRVGAAFPVSAAPGRAASPASAVPGSVAPLAGAATRAAAVASSDPPPAPAGERERGGVRVSRAGGGGFASAAREAGGRF